MKLIVLLIVAAAAGAPVVKLPAEVQGRPGRLITIEADAGGRPVRWHVCPGPDQPDLWMAPDGRTLLFVSPTAGRYELIAWTAAGDVPSEAAHCTVRVEEPPPSPPADPFVAAVNKAWADESAAEKLRQRDLLAGLYRLAASDTVRQPKLQTLGDLLATLRQAAASLLAAEALAPLRAAIAAELQRLLPTAAATPLDDPLRERCGKAFLHIAETLDTLR